MVSQHSMLINNYVITLLTDDGGCSRDPISTSNGDSMCDDDQLLKGAFTDVYQKALKEELPESEPKIKNNIDYKLSMRQVYHNEVSIARQHVA